MSGGNIGKTSYIIEVETNGIDDILALNRETARMREEFSTLGGGIDEAEKELLEWANQIGLGAKEVEELKKVTSETAKIADFSKSFGFDAAEVKRLKDEMKAAGRETDKTKGLMSQLGAVIKVAAASKFVSMFIGYSKEMLNAAASHEDLSVAMKVMLGDTEKANVVLGDLAKFANTTPYSPEQVNASGKALLAFGVEAKDLEPTLRSLGDVAAGTGMSIEELSEIYGKNLTQGVIQTEDLMQLAGRGIPIFEEMAKVLGTTSDKVKGMASSGQIQFEHLQKAFGNMSGEGGKYAGMMNELSGTWNGLSSTLSGNIDSVKKGIGEMILTALKPLLECAVAFTSWAAENETVMTILKAAFAALGVVIGGLFVASIILATPVLWGFAAAALAAAAPFLPIIAIIAAVAAAVYLFVANIESVIDAFTTLGEYVLLGIEKITDFFAWLGQKISEPYIKAFNFIKGVFNSFVSFVKAVPDKIVGFFKSIPGRIMAVFVSFKQKIKDFLKGILPEAVWNFFIKWNTDNAKPLEARASGGPVSGGSPFLVGEKGPELFVPKTSGGIIPNEKLVQRSSSSRSGSVNISFNTTINASGNDIKDIKHAVEEVIRDAIPSIREKLALEAV